MGPLLHDARAFAVILSENDERPALHARRGEVGQRVGGNVRTDGRLPGHRATQRIVNRRRQHCGRRRLRCAGFEMNSELIENAFGVGQNVHEMQNRRALVAAYVGDARLQKRLGDGENALTVKFLAVTQTQRLDFLGKRALGHDQPPKLPLGAIPQVRLDTISTYAGTSASTRSGLPEPLTIFNGGAMTTAPVGGSLSRLVRLASPKRFEPCMMVWQGNMGSKLCAWPASVPTVSTPTPRMSRSLARNGTHCG